jgi:hypothetical protein
MGAENRGRIERVDSIAYDLTDVHGERDGR